MGLWGRKIYDTCGFFINALRNALFSDIFNKDNTKGGAYKMKNLIIYASKTGTTKKCAALLAANLGAESCTLWNIDDGEPELSGFDCAAVGSYIRMGVIDKRISAFIEKHREQLFTMPFGVFFCGCLEDKVSEAIIKNFDDSVLEHALCVECFGGVLEPEKQSGPAKFVLKMMLKAAKGDPGFRVSNEIFPERISYFAKEISGAAE